MAGTEGSEPAEDSTVWSHEAASVTERTTKMTDENFRATITSHTAAKIGHQDNSKRTIFHLVMIFELRISGSTGRSSTLANNKNHVPRRAVHLGAGARSFMRVDHAPSAPNVSSFAQTARTGTRAHRHATAGDGAPAASTEAARPDAAVRVRSIRLLLGDLFSHGVLGCPAHTAQTHMRSGVLCARHS